MSTTTKFEINGVIDTNKSILDNINLLANSSGCFVTWEPNLGKWSLILNDIATAVAVFDDSTIVGSLSVTGSGVNELYNSVTIEFPHKDLNDRTDFIDLKIPADQRFPQELDNNLKISLPTVNDPVQAQYIASRELKQSRVDKIIQFSTDYTRNGLNAGDIIAVNSTVYSYVNKLFRIISINEQDGDDGNLLYSISALEYDADVYSTAGLVREERNVRTGIVRKPNNPELQQLDDVKVGNDIFRLLIGNAAAALLKNLLKFDEETGVLTNDISFQDENLQSLMESFEPPTPTISTSSTGPSGSEICAGDSVTFETSTSCTSCYFPNPSFTYDYEITGVTLSDVTPKINDAVVGLTGKVALGASIVVESNSNIQQKLTMVVSINGVQSTVIIYPTATESYNVSASPSSFVEGTSTTVTITTTGVADGTQIPYTISGTATEKVSSPALTGNVTINSNTATLTIETIDDTVVTGSQGLTFTIAPDVEVTPCGTFDFSVNVTVTDNDVEPPPPPPPPPNTTCIYVQVPVVWCGVYNGEDQQLQSVTVRRTAYLPVAQAGEATVLVPTSLTVTKGNPSTISVASTVEVAASANLGGLPFNVLTSFNSVPPLGLITGTGTSVYGYDF
jgi:hypothetical protein